MKRTVIVGGNALMMAAKSLHDRGELSDAQYNSCVKRYLAIDEKACATEVILHDSEE